MNVKKLSLLIVILILSACAEQPKKSMVLVPVEERNSPIINNPDKASQAEVSPYANSNEVDKKTEPVIVALISEADALAKQGNADKAAASIERGLRIDPRNALLWHHLALIRFQQQQWQQAIVLARKSNALAAKDIKLKSENWGVIANAYEKLGDKQKANEARKKQSGQA